MSKYNVCILYGTTPVCPSVCVISTGKTDSIILSEYQQNGEWSLVDTTAENREYNFPDKNAPFPYVR